ncbi:MAG: hypothetical protein FWJ85_13650 [Solitalea sp.]
MTFEEFFQKKKIDLKALASERPALFEEFKAHYEAMGEKSFDHTKKYWFNKLRRSYPLPVQETPVTETRKSTAAAVAKPARTGSETAPVASKPTGFKPRFKAGKTVAKPQPAEEAEEEAATANPAAATKPVSRPTGFKPRFKAGSTPSQKKDAGE